MVQITGGRVVYGRTVQPAQYESKKAEVEFTFGVEDGAYSEAEFDKIKDAAIAKCHEMVGVKQVLPPASTATGGQAPKPEVKPKAEKSSKEAAAAKMNAKDGKGPVAADSIELDAGPTPNISKSPEDRKDPAQDPDGLDLAAGPQPITDTQLQEAVQAKMKEINNGKAIKAVREKYVQVPKSIKDIPQEQRAAFLVDLKALTK